MTRPGDDSQWCLAGVEQAYLLVDGAEYFAAFYRAAVLAEHSILIAGWQFDPHIDLIRGHDAPPGDYPVSLWELLNALCADKPELSVFILVWDYSLIYAFERTWLQMMQARIGAHERLHFRWRPHVDPRGSHHQKMVVIDGNVAFVGGLDFGNARWDTRSHAPNDERRLDSSGGGRRPFHDVQVAVKGQVAEKLEELFWEGWHEAADFKYGPTPVAPESRIRKKALKSICGPEALPIAGARVAISRTSPPGESSQGTCETLHMYEKLIVSAQRLIYVETQYFTSSAVSRAFLARMSNKDLPALQLVFVMPAGADSPKEKFALGNRQEQVLAAICTAAQEFGHEVRVLYSGSDTSNTQLATFIHSKLMIVDDAAISVGSANLTNRSMGLDTEVILTWNAGRNASVDPSVTAIRASLLAEHAGVDDTDQFSNIEGLVDVLDALCERQDSKLAKRHIEPANAADPLISALFDPSTVLEQQDWDRVWEETLNDSGVLKRSWEALKELLSSPGDQRA